MFKKFLGLLMILFIMNVPVNAAASSNIFGQGFIDADNPCETWDVIVNSEGLLTVDFESDVEANCVVSLLDTDGVKEIEKVVIRDKREGNLKKDLGPGKHYIKVQREGNSDFSYKLKTSFETSDYLIGTGPLYEEEPNDKVEFSKALVLDGGVKGNLGYYYDGKYDEVDYWNFTLPNSGEVNFNLELTRTGAVLVELIDIDGERVIDKAVFQEPSLKIAESNEPSLKNLKKRLKRGTYYLRVRNLNRESALSYKLNGEFKESLYRDESEEQYNEENDRSIFAKNLDINAEVQGQLGYYCNGYVDREDWWKIELAGDGSLKSIVDSDVKASYYICIFDETSLSLIKRTYVKEGTTGEVSASLLKGKYFIKLETCDSSFSYKIVPSLNPPFNGGDEDKNDEWYLAQKLEIGEVYKGDLGYTSGNYKDVKDYFKISIPKDGNLNISFTSNTNPNASLKLFTAGDPSVPGSNYLGKLITYNDINSIGVTALESKNIKAGDYYIELSSLRDGSFFYILNPSFSSGNPMDFKLLETFPKSEEKIKDDSFISVVFSTVLNPNTIASTGKKQSNSFVVRDKNNVKIKGTVHAKGTIALFVPEEPLKNNESYRVSITKDVSDMNGANLDKDYTWIFLVDNSNNNTEKPKEKNKAPEARNVKIQGEPYIGSVLKGIYDYYDVDGDPEHGTSFRWLRVDSKTQEYKEILGEYRDEYRLTLRDKDSKLIFEVTPKTYIEPKEGIAVKSLPVKILDSNSEDIRKVPVNKVFKIKFTKPVDENSLENNIYIIKKSTQEKYKIQLEVSKEDPTVVEVHHASGTFDINEIYTLVITEKVKSKAEKNKPSKNLKSKEELEFLPCDISDLN